MSEPVRVAFVVEGPTDFVVLRAVIHALLDDREFEPTVLQPELSEAFSAETGGGWTKVYLWCRQAAEQAGGAARGNLLFSFHDVLVLQVDADVAGKSYGDDCRLKDHPGDLPCEQPCPPPHATTNALRNVVLGWLGEPDSPPKLAMCTPSKSLETWVLVALFPNDQVAKRANVECQANSAAQLQSKPLAQRLIRSGQKLIDKYQGSEQAIRAAWPHIRTRCSEAERFSRDFLSALPPL
jgi:hypothetical protein